MLMLREMTWIKRGLAIMIAAVCLGPSALAATAPAAPPPTAGQGLEISPPLIQTAVNPGQTVNLSVRVHNITTSNLVISTTVDDFGAKGEDGQPQILLDETSSTRYSLKYWAGATAPITLQPQEAKMVTVTVKVPANAEPGGHYGVIRFSGTPPGLSSSGVAISASIGTLVLLTVNGDITQHLKAVDITISSKGQNGRFFQYGPFDFTERLNNDGNVHVEPTGNVVVKDMFGHQVASLAFNKTKGNILPDSIRKFSQSWNKHALFGRYTLTGALAYGNGKTLNLPTTAFWVIPYKLVIIVLVILFLLLFLGRWGLRRYNAYIISQARR